MRSSVGRFSLPRQTKHILSLGSLYTATLAASSAFSSKSSWASSSLLPSNVMRPLNHFRRDGCSPPSSIPQYRVTALMAVFRRQISSSSVSPGRARIALTNSFYTGSSASCPTLSSSLTSIPASCCSTSCTGCSYSQHSLTF